MKKEIVKPLATKSKGVKLVDGGEALGTVPRTIRIPTLFVDFPLIKSGVRNLVNGDSTRYSTLGNIKSATLNPLHPNEFKLLITLLFTISTSNDRESYKMKDIMFVTGVSGKAISRRFDFYIERVKNLRYTLVFSEKKEIPKVLRKYISSEGSFEISAFITSIYDSDERKRGKARYIIPRFSEESLSLFEFENISYVSLSTSVLRKLKTTEELMIYLLSSKRQKIHGKDYLILYFLNCTQWFLRERIPENKIDSVRKKITRIYSRCLESLEKLKGLKVIKDYKYVEEKIKIGKRKRRTVPFFGYLEIHK